MLSPQRRCELLSKSVLGRSVLAQFGGEGSGNYGHAGCPGTVGGSCGPGGGELPKDPQAMTAHLKQTYENLQSVSYGHIDAMANHLSKNFTTPQVQQIAKDMGGQSKRGKSDSIAFIKDRLSERKGRQERSQKIQDAFDQQQKDAAQVQPVAKYKLPPGDPTPATKATPAVEPKAVEPKAKSPTDDLFAGKHAMLDKWSTASSKVLAAKGDGSPASVKAAMDFLRTQDAETVYRVAVGSRTMGGLLNDTKGITITDKDKTLAAIQDKLSKAGKS